MLDNQGMEERIAMLVRRGMTAQPQATTARSAATISDRRNVSPRVAHAQGGTPVPRAQSGSTRYTHQQQFFSNQSPRPLISPTEASARIILQNGSSRADSHFVDRAPAESGFYRHAAPSVHSPAPVEPYAQSAHYEASPVPSEIAATSEVLAVRMYHQEKADRQYVERLFLVREEFHARQRLSLDEANGLSLIHAAQQHDQRLITLAAENVRELDAVQRRLEDQTNISRLRRDLTEATERVQGEREMINRLQNELRQRDAERRDALERDREAFEKEKLRLLRRLESLENTVAALSAGGGLQQQELAYEARAPERSPPRRYSEERATGAHAEGNKKAIDEMKLSWQQERNVWARTRDEWQNDKAALTAELARLSSVVQETHAQTAAAEQQPVRTTRPTMEELARAEDSPRRNEEDRSADDVAFSVLRGDYAQQQGITSVISPPRMQPQVVVPQAVSSRDLDESIARTTAVLQRASRLLAQSSA